MNRKVLIVAIAAILIIVGVIAEGNSYAALTSLPLTAEIEWIQTEGPPGGRVRKLTQNPYHHNELYVLSEHGVYRSEDKGENWEIMKEFENISVISLVPFQDKIFVGGPNGVYSYDNESALTRVFDHWCDEVIVSDDKLLVTSSSGDVINVKILYANLTSENFLWRDISPSESELSDLIVPPEDIGFGYQVGAQQIVVLGNKVLANIVLEVGGSGEFSNGHLYRSEDLGETWFKVDLGTQDDVIVANIIQDPWNSEHILLSFRHNILHEFKSPVSDLVKESFDGGITWNPVTNLNLRINGITDVDVVGSAYYLLCPFDSFILRLNSSGYETIDMPTLEEYENFSFNLGKLLFDFDDPNIVYGETDSVWELGILKSEDNMKTWKKMDSDIIASSPSIVLVHPTDPDIMFATGNVIQESYFTRDGGITWEPFSPNNADDEVKIDPHNPNHILLIDENTNIYESYDLGETFNNINQDFSSAKVFDFEIAKDNPEKIYVSNIGVGISEYLSSGSEGEWRYMIGSPDYAYDIEIDPTDSNILYATYSPKIFENHSSIWRYSKYEEENFGWSEILRIENSTGITSLKFDPNDPNRMYAGVIGDEGEIYVSNDKGETWNKLNDNFTMLTVWGQPQLIVDPNNSSIAYAATWLAGTWKTKDAGETWTLLDDAPISSTALSLDKKDTNVIYLADRSSPTVWKSTDGGQTWEEIADFASEGALLVMRVLADGDTVYASTFYPSLLGGKLYKSTDGGSIWSDITGTLPEGILDLAIDPTNSDIVYLTTNIHGAYKSTDGGTTWNKMMNFPDVGAYDIEIDPDDPTILYSAARGGSLPSWFTEIAGVTGGINFTDDAGVYKSTDSGATWNKTLTTTVSCRAIRRHPDNPSLLFAPDLVDGLQMSVDGGNTWIGINEGLDNAVPTSVAVSGNKIYVGTQGCGVYSGDLDVEGGTVTWQPSRSNKPVPKVYQLQIRVDPKNSENIFVSSYPGGLYASTNGGVTFRDRNAITPSVVVDDPIRQGYYTYTIDPNDTSKMWVGTWGRGIYKSYNSMILNVPMNLFGKHIYQIVVDPNESNTVYAATQEGVFVTRDDGLNWEEMNGGLRTRDVRSIRVVEVGYPPFKDDFEDGNADDWDLESGWSVIEESGNFVLQGVGHKWARAGSENWMNYTFTTNLKLISGTVHVNFRTSSEGRYFLGFNEEGLYLEKQRLSNFSHLGDNPDFHDLNQWYNLTVELNGSNIQIYVDGILKIEYADPEPFLYGAIAFETLDDSQVYVDDVNVNIDPIDPLVFAGTGGYGIYRFHPSTAEWKHLGRTLGRGWWSAWDRRMYQFSSLLFDPVTPGKVYLGHFPSGFFVSEDNGHTWKDSSLGLGNDGIFSLTMHPHLPNVIWGGTYNGVVESVDGGKTWRLRSQGMPPEQWPYTVAIDTENPNIMYASTKNGQNKGLSHRNDFFGVVMKSTDGGENWFKIMNGLGDRSEFYTLLIYPLNHNILFLSTSNGVYLSKDAGNNWEPINNGLSSTCNQVRDNVADNLALTPDNKYLVLGLNGHGVWKADLSSTVFFGTPTQEPTGNITPDQEVTVSINITAPENSVKNVTLSYTTDNGITWNNLMMENLTSTLHQATIPEQPYGVSVKYRIIVYDNAENAVAEDRNGEYYVYQVIPEFPSLLVLPLFMIATLLAVIVYRRKQF